MKQKAAWVMVVYLVVFILALIIASCDEAGNSGGNDCACEDEYRGLWTCYNSMSESNCSKIDGYWAGGVSCQDLGYTKHCRDNIYVKPWGTCP